MNPHKNTDQYTHQDVLHDVLHDLASQEIPDTMHTLWPAIQAELKTRPDRRLRHLTRLGWITTMIVLSLMVSAGAYAFVQLGGYRDPGMQQIQDMDLVTYLDQSITIDGVTVTLDWAYVDTHRAALAYQMTHDESSDADMYPILAAGPGHLSTGEIDLPPMSGGGGGNPTGDGNILFEANANYEAHVIEGSPDDITLRFELMVNAQEGPITEGQLPVGGGFGGGGGGGGGSSDEAPTDNTAPNSTPTASGSGGGFDPGMTIPGFDLTPVGPFVFEFTIPVHHAVVTEVNETVSTNGLDVTLQEVSVAPSMTWLTLCYDLPTGEDVAELGWQPVAVLEPGDPAAAQRSSRSGWISRTGQHVCTGMGFLVAYDDAPATWTLTVQRLQTPSREYTFAEMQVALAAYGIEIAENEDAPEGQMGWHITHVPEGVDSNAAVEAAFDSFTEMIEGPWTFTFDVPGTE